MDDLVQSVNDVAAHDRFYGIFTSQILYCYNREQHLLATIGLFVLVEHSVKQAADMMDGKFHDALTKLHKEKRITDKEYGAIDKLKKIRNMIFHENLHSGGMTFGDGVMYPFNENETYKKLLDSDIGIFLQITKKLQFNQSQIDSYQ